MRREDIKGRLGEEMEGGVMRDEVMGDGVIEGGGNGDGEWCAS